MYLKKKGKTINKNKKEDKEDKSCKLVPVPFFS
jgi:hypothetical protein